MRKIFSAPALLVALAVMAFFTVPVWAAPQTQAGPYRIELTTDPATVPIGKAKLRLKVTDQSGRPVSGAAVRALTRMPGMAMGEREETAKPTPDMAGVYEAPAAFPMGGGYEVALKISGAAGEASGTIALQTGQSTADNASAGGSWLLIGALPLLAVFIAWRMRRTGQRLNWRAVLHGQALAGIAVLLLMFFVARYAVNHWRRPGSMTPLEAQGMEMNMPAPEGSTPVELATVQTKPLRSMVRYTGQAVGYNEQEVYARVTGNLLWMPFYAGDKVKRGQLLARLDRSQIDPQIAGQRAARDVAEEGTSVARLDYQQAQAAVRQAEAELDGKRGAIAEALSTERKTRAQAKARSGAVQEAVAAERKARAQSANRSGAVAEAIGQEKQARAGLKEAGSALKSARAAVVEAQSDLAGAREERETAEAVAAAVAAQIPDTRAQLATAQADVKFETLEVERLRVLVTGGAVAARELQRQEAQVQNAKSRVRQAQAAIARAEAEANAAQARVRRTDSTIRSAQAREQGARAAVESAQARIEGAKADIAAAKARVEQQRSEVTGAGADVSGAKARIRQMQEDARAAQAEIGASKARVEQARAALSAGEANVRRMRAQAGAARGRIAQAQAGVGQAEAGVSQATTAAGYTEIRSLLDGVVTQRLISPGTLVSSGQAILKVAQINPIRLQANVAEADLQRVRVGTLVTVRDRDNKGRPVTARVTAVAPAVDAQTRTGVVEAIVSNANRRFRPGEYVVMEIVTGQSRAPLSVPASAVQQRAALSASEKPASYVWVAEAAPSGQVTVRPVTVQTGVSDGTSIEIRSGLKPGQRVVTEGYENLTEGDIVTTTQSRLADSRAAMAPMPQQQVRPNSGVLSPQSANITVTEKGFEPASVTLRAGAPMKLIFTRKTDATCATEVVFPDYNIKKVLPLNEPVTIEITPKKSGTLNYACGMDMLRGQVVVR